MIRKITLASFASLLILASGLSVRAVNLFTNPSFETPASPVQSVRQVDDTNAGGWKTTHPSGSWCGTAGNCRPIEFWANSFGGVTSGQAAQHVELNAFDRSMVFQRITLAGGDKLNWSFLHRGRGSDTTPDVAEFRIGIPGGLTAGSVAQDSYSYSIVTVSTTANGTFTTPTGGGTIHAPASVGNGWVRYSGTYTYTPAAGTPSTVNVGFLSVSSSGGDAGVGNFIDDVNVDRSSCCPPWNPTQLAQHMFYEGSGAIAGNYMLDFHTSPAMNGQMQSYVEYLNSTNSGITSIIIEWMFYDQGTGAVPMTWPTGSSPGNNGTPVAGPMYRTWTANGSSNPNTSPIPPTPAFFPGYPMQVGTWYLVHTGIYLNDGHRFFPDECSENDIFVRIDVAMKAKGGNPVLEIRNKKGETLRRDELKNKVEIRQPNRRQDR
ncbi:MAG TPA: hypothetical protein VF659_14500 [Pyrinomonadaceae bacterium]|jgi:hypothetical protein